MAGFPLRTAFALASGLIGTMVDAAAVGNMVERSVTSSNGKLSTVLVNRGLTQTNYKVRRESYETNSTTSTFFKDDKLVALCTPQTDKDGTVIDSSYAEDCSYILSYYRSEDQWGWWNIDDLVPGVDFKLIQHNTCSLYTRVPEGHFSLQISNADLEAFVNTTMHKYSRGFNDGRAERVQGDGTLQCFETDGETELVATLSMRR
ncbi:hypothetical protein KJ359_009532 [Pestalotiopsis sp. 9143b]|nr:hypothetical protein KJ359_009532 [Pestalotiopsis sp. 9143b]